MLRTSGRLADWQDTYGKLEIYEVDDLGLKWLQYSFEFNWWNKTCRVDDTIDETTGNYTKCSEAGNLLPLTSKDANAAYFEFTMPKNYGDMRTAPLIVTWSDITTLPYSLRPELDYEYTNLTFTEVSQGTQFGLTDIWDTFQAAIIATAILFCCFLAVMILSCFVSGDRKTRYDFMIDTRNLKTTFRHTPDTLMLPPKDILSRSRFSCAFRL